MESQMTRRNGKGLEKTGKLFENIKIKKKKNTKENYISPGKRQKIIDDLVI